MTNNAEHDKEKHTLTLIVMMLAVAIIIILIFALRDYWKGKSYYQVKPNNRQGAKVR